MWELFTHPSNIVFSISLSLMLMFAALECILLLLGGGSQNMLEQFLPEDPCNQKLIQINIPAFSPKYLTGYIWDVCLYLSGSSFF